MNDARKRDGVIAIFVGVAAYTVTIIAPELKWLMITVVMCVAGWLVWRLRSN